MTEAPLLSVIVPAYQCATTLRACLNGLVASDLPRVDWELLVVDDGSTDDTPLIAQTVADSVLTVLDGPRGPAHARNVGAQTATGHILVFVDADVVLAPGTLSRFATLFVRDPSLAAAFGAYDGEPADPGIVSQYRNLLHRYVHLQHPGNADTFWAGCGAVRREVFLRIGGFDSARYPRPQIEDIDLGYRLRDVGARILSDPMLVGRHLKRWTLVPMLGTDLRGRAIPWMHLLLSRRDVFRARALNLTVSEKLFTALAGVALASLVPALLLQRNAVWGWLAAACGFIILVGNARLFAWFASQRGWRFALATLPLRLLYYFVSAGGGMWAVLTHGGQAVPIALPPLHPTGKLRGTPQP